MTDLERARQIINDVDEKMRELFLERMKASKVVALKKLDQKAKRPAEIFTYTFGIIAVLIAGTGMSLAMQAIGSGVVSMVAGIVIGIIGFILCGINYPIYKRMLERDKAKYAYEIVELAREISEEK